MIDEKLSQELIIFPNKLSQRRYEQNIALKNGFCNKSNFLTFEAFKNKIFSTSDVFFNVIPKSEKLLISIQLIENFKKINCDRSMNSMNNFSCFSDDILKYHHENINFDRHVHSLRKLNHLIDMTYPYFIT